MYTQKRVEKWGVVNSNAKKTPLKSSRIVIFVILLTVYFWKNIFQDRPGLPNYDTKRLAKCVFFGKSGN